MNLMESITSFFRRSELESQPKLEPEVFWGRLERNLVQSEKPIIVFDHPRILMQADTVEEATTFVAKARQSGEAPMAAVYQHDTNHWLKVAIN